jgi:malonyl-CoA decarboxylase
VNTSFFGELLQSIAERGRALIDRTRDRRESAERQSATLVELCDQLLSGRGEASGVAIAREILQRYSELTSGPRIAFFEALAARFGPDHKRLEDAVTAWRNAPSDEAAIKVHRAAEPRRQELLRRLNLAPGGTAALVRMREQLIDALDRRDDLKVVDNDFVHMFSSWFHRGFLVLRRIDWSTPAMVLEKIIRYEAVHRIRSWDDLRRRIDPADRRCYAFFHPAMPDAPLIFVEVALTETIPGAIAPLLAEERQPVAIERARTAVFYSISNTQRGLGGISFGSFLIKQVVEELRRELPKLDTFITLSPVPNFMQWLKEGKDVPVTDDDRKLFENLDKPDWFENAELTAQLRAVLEPLAAHYFLKARTAKGRLIDSVARFHLGNGARLERINWLGDLSPKGLRESAGIMVNYLYRLDDIEKNHEAYANEGEVVASSAVKKLLKGERRLLDMRLS